MGFVNFFKKIGHGIANAGKVVGNGVKGFVTKEIPKVAKTVYNDVLKPGGKLVGKAWDKVAPYIAKYGDKASEVLLTIPGLEEFAPLAESVTIGAKGYEGGKALAKAYVDKNPAEAIKGVQTLSGLRNTKKK